MHSRSLNGVFILHVCNAAKDLVVLDAVREDLLEGLRQHCGVKAYERAAKRKLSLDALRLIGQ